MAGKEDVKAPAKPGDRAAAEQRTEQLLAEVERLTGEVDALNRQLSAQRGQTTRARNEVAALEAEMPDRPRTLEPLENQLEARELLELISRARRVEVAFSEGRREIAGVAPREISGDAWRVVAGRVRLRVPSLLVHGPRAGDPPFQLAGYALLLDGQLVATSRRGDVLSIGAGASFELKDDVAF